MHRPAGCGSRCNCPEVARNSPPFSDTAIVNGNLTREPNYVILSTEELGVADKVGRPGTTVLCDGLMHNRALTLSVTTLGHVHETGSGHFLFPQLRQKGGGGSGSQDARRPLLFQVTVPKWRSDFKQAHTDLSNETAKSGAVSYEGAGWNRRASLADAQQENRCWIVKGENHGNQEDDVSP